MKHQLDPPNWVAQYSDYLFSLAMYKLNDPTCAKDLVQDTFTAAWAAREKFRGEASEKTWLTTILKNKIADFFRSAKTHLSLNQYIETTGKTVTDHYYDTRPKTYGHVKRDTWEAYYNADTAVNQGEINKIIRYCLEKLPGKLKGIFCAKYMDEKKPAEICNEFDITTSNYWVILHRTKLLLQTCIKNAGGI
ncbi:MAG: sigma-70 family RNA polymerase sigma factor [Dinghuibacter sp.]|nr:sigma-70 family RNA polymerase sigma factor [Dinghuibacter sp.]